MKMINLLSISYNHLIIYILLNKNYSIVQYYIGDTMYFNLVFKTIFMYFFVIFVYRIMGKKEVGQLSIVDLIVSILIAELIALSIGTNKQSIFISLST